MKKISVTNIIMDNGEVIKVEGIPETIISELTDKDGEIINKFIRYGVDYINPRNVSLLRYEEENEEDPLVFY